MSDWGPVFVAVVLFILLTPGLLVQIPGRQRLVEFGNFQTSGASILVHSILYFALICIFLLAIGVHVYVGSQPSNTDLPVTQGCEILIVLIFLNCDNSAFLFPFHDRCFETDSCSKSLYLISLVKSNAVLSLLCGFKLEFLAKSINRLDLLAEQLHKHDTYFKHNGLYIQEALRTIGWLFLSLKNCCQ